MTIRLIYRALRKGRFLILQQFYTPITKFLFYINGVRYGNNLKILGFLKVDITRRGFFSVGNNFKINSGNNYNVIGRQQKTIFCVEGKLTIGSNVGMSSTAIICNHKITIGNYVKLGGGVCIYDTDFHDLNPEIRRNQLLDKQNAAKSAVVIEDNVFIGAHSTILKGVTIGENSIVGACSLVSRSIPANQIWGGNPAKFIKDLN